MENGLVWPHDDKFADFAGAMLHGDHISGAERNFGIEIAALAHPGVAIHLAEIAHAGIGKESDHEAAGGSDAGQFQGSQDAAAARTSGENAFGFRKTAREDEAFAVGHLHYVVEHVKMHG